MHKPNRAGAGLLLSNTRLLEQTLRLLPPSGRFRVAGGGELPCVAIFGIFQAA